MFSSFLEAYLEDDEAMEAEIFVNKASSFMNNTSNWSLQLRYRVTSARVMDANRKFLDAAARYYEISSTTNTNINQNDLLELLGKSITCAVLGKAGIQRGRLISIISKDPRLSKLEHHSQYSGHPAVLRKIHGGQLLRANEFSTFENSLLPHQKAVRANSGKRV
jgi:COP9 signalosome complex subunit 4